MPDPSVSPVIAMTADDVRERVRLIESKTWDNEMAHWEEDRLLRDVLAAIAGGAPNAAELAEEALKTLAIEFAHWYA